MRKTHVDLGGVINARIDTALEYLWIVRGLRRRLIGSSCQMDIQEGRNVTEVEQAAISELDGL